MKNCLIEFVDVVKKYQSGDSVLIALNSISFKIKYGEFVSLVGESGSGKSTCMNILGCLDTPTCGSYFLMGKNIGALGKNELATIRNQHIGFVFQQYNLLNHYTVWENVATPLLYAGIGRSERKERAMVALQSVGLPEKAYRIPTQLSGGQQQRVSIARAIINQPDILLADEPTGALDSKTSNEIMDLFEEINSKGTTIILVTHNNDLAKRGSRRMELHDGIIKSDKYL